MKTGTGDLLDPSLLFQMAQLRLVLIKASINPQAIEAVQ
jgi:hypothetical protein